MGIPMKARGRHKSLIVMVCVAAITVLSGCSDVSQEEARALREAHLEILLSELEYRGFSNPRLVGGGVLDGSSYFAVDVLEDCRVTLRWDGRVFHYGDLDDVDARLLATKCETLVCVD